jgi:hypothetical protein
MTTQVSCFMYLIVSIIKFFFLKINLSREFLLNLFTLTVNEQLLLFSSIT